MILLKEKEISCFPPKYKISSVWAGQRSKHSTHKRRLFTPSPPPSHEINDIKLRNKSMSGKRNMSPEREENNTKYKMEKA